MGRLGVTGAGGTEDPSHARVIFIAGAQKLFPPDSASAEPMLDLPPLDTQQATVDLAQAARRPGKTQTVFRGVRLEPWTLGFAAKWLGDDPVRYREELGAPRAAVDRAWPLNRLRNKLAHYELLDLATDEWKDWKLLSGRS